MEINQDWKESRIVAGVSKCHLGFLMYQTKGEVFAEYAVAQVSTIMYLEVEHNVVT